MSIEKYNELDRTLNRVLDMLKYAEAKNAVLLTFESGVLYMLFETVLNNEAKIGWKHSILIPIISSMIILLISFIPNLFKSMSDCDQTNIQFFGDIAKLSAKDYGNLYNDNLLKEDKFTNDIICQIHYNSRITNRKFKAYKLAISVLFVIPWVLKIIVQIYLKCAKKISEV